MNRSAAAMVLCLVAIDVSAQSNGAGAGSNGALHHPRVELWVAASGVSAGPSGTLLTSYSPPLLFDGDFSSHGGQTLAADAQFAVGVSGGINVFPTRQFGFQILIDRVSCDVSAANAGYVVGLQYVSRPPPSGDPQLVTVNQSSAWPDTSGSLTQFVVGFNAVVRVGRPDRVSVILAGGPSYNRVKGLVQPLGFTTFHLGGHSVLFQQDYRLAISMEPAGALGLNTGAELNVVVGRHAAIVSGFRYFAGPDLEIAVHPSAILNADELTLPQSIGDVAARIAPIRTQLAGSGSRVYVGVKWLP